MIWVSPVVGRVVSKPCYKYQVLWASNRRRPVQESTPQLSSGVNDLSGFKYPIFWVSDSKSHQEYGFGNQKPKHLGIWTFWKQAVLAGT